MQANYIPICSILTKSVEVTMAKDEKQERTREIEIDPDELREGTCHIRKFGEGKISICKEHGKIKIFEVDKEE